MSSKLKYIETPDFHNLTVKELQVNWFKKNYPEFFQYLEENYPKNLKFTEKLYWYVHNLTETPKCTCGNPRKFRNYKYGYNEFCSTKCSNNNSNKIQKTKKTNLKRYGVEVPAQSSEIQHKMRDTTLERYGVDNYLKLVEHNGPGKEALEKMKKTCLERYGAENVMTLKEFQDKNKSKKNYKEISKKIWNTRHEKFIEENEFLESVTEDGMWICKCPHPDCNKCSEKNYSITSQMFHDRQRDGTEPCTRLLKSHLNNNKNTTLEIFIKRILDHLNIEYITNDRTILAGKELDVYIPGRKIAIECNGVYSHCTKQVSSKYHINKWNDCKSQEIQLLNIWEDWIRNKPDIIESIIKSKMGIFENRIGARQCMIKEVSSQDSGKFLDNNHIQGKTGGSVRLGLYYKDELVSLMLFGKNSGCSASNGWCLSRFCTKKNYQVIGGANKLLKEFIKQYNPEIIYSFASNDISDGGLYKKLGFEEEEISQSYWYIRAKGLKRYHRSTFTKSSIRKRWNIKEDFMESDEMYKHGYYQIYDSGTTKYILKHE